jgi:hypothetical protein
MMRAFCFRRVVSEVTTDPIVVARAVRLGWLVFFGVIFYSGSG